MAKVDFVVCAWNNRSSIGATLESIERQTVRDRTCCVVDGRSTDGTQEYIRANFPWARLVVKETNSGPAGSRSLGCELGSAQYIVFVDSDVTLEPDWTEQQLRFFDQHPEAGMLCGKLLYAPIPAMLHTAYGVMNRFGVGWDGAIGQPADSFTTPVRCVWANTSAIAVRREMIDRMGAFDVELFGYHEDGDFGWRANLFGYSVISNPAAVATHQVHGTPDPALRNESQVYLIWRNRIRSSLVNYEWTSLLRYVAPYVVLSIGNAILKAPRRVKFRALWWNVINLPGTLERRRFVQKNRCVRDRDLWPLFVPGLLGPGYDAVDRAARAFSARRPVPLQETET
jgi:GT2 family glycosyltransferase